MEGITSPTVASSQRTKHKGRCDAMETPRQGRSIQGPVYLDERLCKQRSPDAIPKSLRLTPSPLPWATAG